MEGTIDLDGAVDIHGHCGPSVFRRRVDGYEFAAEASAAGMDAVVLKEHHLPTAYGIPYIERLLERDEENIDVFGGVVLNYCNGGYNPFMVQTAIDYGAKSIWAPTLDAKHHAGFFGGVGQYGSWISDKDRSLGREYEGKSGISALNDDGELTKDVKLCIDKIIKHDVILALGHISYPEIDALVSYAADRGHEKIVIDHPTYFVTDLSIEQQKELVSKGAWMNYVFAGLSPKAHWHSSSDLYENINAVGVDNVVVSSDMGQVANPSSPEGLRIMGELLLQEGLSESAYTQLVETNPKTLLDLQ